MHDIIITAEENIFSVIEIGTISPYPIKLKLPTVIIVTME